jgi:hypothetical protein
MNKKRPPNELIIYLLCLLIKIFLYFLLKKFNLVLNDVIFISHNL